MASSGCDTRVGVTCALPPPCTIPREALGPITAIDFTAETSSGKTGVPAMLSLRNNTIADDDARRNVAMSSASVRETSGPGGTSVPPVRSIRFKILRAQSRTSSADTSPRSTAATSASPRCNVGPGISRSSPATTPSTVECNPNQSLTTMPSKFHSPRKTSRSNHVESAAYGPLMRL
ncbi:unannotated protein [freshwater metagenome]|uniref:Unannotated protein n=1 Tax=freshwater metagenome TaxID=449393 RepID=A0A6J6VRA1_9ZZZZ